MLAFGIVRRAGLDDHADADDRLLVLAHQYDLHAVGQLAEFVRREGHRPRRKWTRRVFTRPFDSRLSSCSVQSLAHGFATGGDFPGGIGGAIAERRLRREHGGQAAEREQGGSGFDVHMPPRGLMRITIRPSGTKYFRATRRMSSSVTFWKVSNSPSAEAMSF